MVSKREIHRGTVLEKVVEGTFTLKKGSELMKISYRQAIRLMNEYRSCGLRGIVHGNRGRPPANKVDKKSQDRIVKLAQGKYLGFNDSHLREKLTEEEGMEVSRETLRKILRDRGIAPKNKRRPHRHLSRRPRRSEMGSLVQMDGSPHRWFGEDRPPCCLMLAVDDATSIPLAGHFIVAESSVGYLWLLYRTACDYGVPLAAYHDRHSSLVRTDDYWSLEEQVQGYQFPTHVGRVFDDLGIESIAAHSPQAKGRIERMNRTLQDRLIAELRLRGIVTMEAANEFLPTFFADFRKRFAVPPAGKESCFIPLTQQEAFDTIAFGYLAVVANDNAIRLGGMTLDLPRLKTPLAKKEVIVKQHLDGSWSVWHQREKIATFPATELREPIRSWKRRSGSKLREEIQVYIASKPLPPRVTLSLGS
jgi:transposase